MIKKKNRGFTLVEVLICVGIIGIIAAITIPALLTSTSSKALEAQRKAFYSRMTQAFGQIKNLKSYDVGEEKSALQLIIGGLSRNYKLSTICKKDNVEDCGVSLKIYDYYSDTASTSFDISKDNPKISQLNEKISASDMGDFEADFAAFKTANGESVLLYYNPKCKSKTEIDHNIMHSVCVNLIYDLNGGANTPNAYGEDIGYMTVFYPTNSSVVAPLLYEKESYTSSSFAQMLTKATDEDLVPPTIEELISILINKNLTNITKSIDPNGKYWSSSYSSDGTTKVWIAGLNDGAMLVNKDGSGASHPYFLIKK